MPRVNRRVLLYAIAGLMPLAILGGALAAAKPAARKPLASRYCQQTITGQPHHKHVLVDNKTGDVTWTFHGGTAMTYPAARLDRMGTPNGPTPPGWRAADTLGLGRFSEKLRVMCSNHGFI